MEIKETSKILVTGGNGFVGMNVIQRLDSKGYRNIHYPEKREIDFRNQAQTEKYFMNEQFDIVFNLAGKVGGIKANKDFPADFIYDNLQIACNVIHSAYKSNVGKLLNLGSSCIYPGESKQPIKEEYLLTGELEKTNEGYAIAKIAGLKLCEYYNKQYNTNFMSFMPCNIYGEYDHFAEGANSHVLPALIPRFHNAMISNDKEINVWGTGKPKREFIYVKDVAEALIFFMENYDAKDLPHILNIGTGKEITIKQLAEDLKEITGFKGKIVYNNTLDGTMRKVMDVSKATKLGWKADVELKDGLKMTYEWYKKHEM